MEASFCISKNFYKLGGIGIETENVRSLLCSSGIDTREVMRTDILLRCSDGCEYKADVQAKHHENNDLVAKKCKRPSQ